MAPLCSLLSISTVSEEVVDKICFRNVNHKSESLLWRCLSHSQRWTHADEEQHPQGDALVQVPVFHGDCHHQPPHKQQVGVLQVLHAHLRQHTESDVCQQKFLPTEQNSCRYSTYVFGLHDAKQGEKEGREESRHGQR